MKKGTRMKMINKTELRAKIILNFLQHTYFFHNNRQQTYNCKNHKVKLLFLSGVLHVFAKVNEPIVLY
jgi:hypothetical protein